ncbi:hypothetical protein ElyMa_006713200, partial [Elysia marginata]
MPTDQPAHQTYNSRYSGKRPRGRLRRRWSDSVADTLKGHNKRDSVKRSIWQLREDYTSPRHLTVQADGKSK